MKSLLNATITIIQDSSQTLIVCGGEWTIHHLAKIADTLESYSVHTPIQWDMSSVTQLDSAGVALVHLYSKQFNALGFPSKIIGRSEEHLQLYNLLYNQPLQDISAVKARGWLYSLGYETHQWFQGINAFLAFLGEVFIVLLYSLSRPWLIRYRAISSHIITAGFNALPIIAVSSFLIGIVVAFQSIVQLQKFGADILIVDMIGISLTRELAPLITAIVIAGRSASAFTAQIGAMKMTQEIDAMKTMGFHPYLFLVWPRIIALMIVLPLLIFFADIVGIFGGMVIAKTQANLSYTEFINRLQGVLPLKHYVIGISKGPFFAILIALVGTYRGFQVSMNTESIGLYTTKSVVNAIFLVIACDALFSILLTELKL
ncbi:MAG TPA: ABC transporter permease [Sulfuricurvum sp.]|nr:MAG: ABC transporter permease [Campylobacterales bacterium 16-40-21]OZA04351.1 MAG: ABC transporter permease [Sulfuricurvum sp. 17-40-25]HQS66374.1 ABC transporter permease [Sulfuricurvum sp.]HQT36247.1 ABC transporter permease [Sulfuricurvum sp.]